MLTTKTSQNYSVVAFLPSGANKTGQASLQNRLQPASVVKIRRIRGDKYLIKKIKPHVPDEHKKTKHKFPSYLHSCESVHSTMVTTQKMSPNIMSDNPVLLGKCPNPVLKMSFLKKTDGHKPKLKVHHGESPFVHSWKPNLDLSPAVRVTTVSLGKCHFLVTSGVTIQIMSPSSPFVNFCKKIWSAIIEPRPKIASPPFYTCAFWLFIHRSA
jgi:hypothetical protein